ncbi:hypothetical protein [Nocardioides sp. AX2bis]|uniref:hypothetical protein n=1 Tax=Nocardioides sp. AX2bis TaxID=2653157 RepID=UPI0012F3A8E0|nr:hypothetical protein [Nocardioides sp. AX2bis]VXB86873.1 conserved exported hypothetical protein [Nocardioides sp. AX2bis]
MTQHASPAARPPGDTPRPLRRAALSATTAVTAVLVLGVALAAPAAAEVPAQGWPENPPVNILDALLLIGGVTLAVILVITVLTVGPALARGERITPGVSVAENQWIGGPRKAAGELAGPDREGSEAGGAGARW